jgi:alkylation response protein AidB-like acyl-CoA dehydrogenase
MNTNFTSPDFYHIDDLLSEEHKLIRESTRQWVSKSVCPIIEDYAQKAEFPKHLIKELGEIGAFGPYIPQKYGVRGIPTLMLFKDGNLIDTKVGSLPKSSLINWIDSHL